MGQEASKHAALVRILNWRVTLSVNSFIMGLALVAHLLNIIVIREPYFTYLLSYVGVNLISSTWVIRRRFVTPEVASPKCPFCGSPMSSTKLKCTNPNCSKEAG